MSSSQFQLHLATEPVVYHSLEQIARDGARRALQKAIEQEVADYVDDHHKLEHKDKDRVIPFGAASSENPQAFPHPQLVRLLVLPPLKHSSNG